MKTVVTKVTFVITVAILAHREVEFPEKRKSDYELPTESISDFYFRRYIFLLIVCLPPRFV